MSYCLTIEQQFTNNIKIRIDESVNLKSTFIAVDLEVAKMKLQIVLLYTSLSFAASSCPCTFMAGSLSCNRGSIEFIPEDIYENCPDIAEESQNVEIIDLQDQPISELYSGSFESFPNLKQLGLSFNEIRLIHEGAFVGLNELLGIYLRHNQISEVSTKPIL